MTAPLAFTTKQIAAIAKGAVKGGCIAEVEVKTGATVVRLIPNAYPQAARPIEPEPEIRL